MKDIKEYTRKALELSEEKKRIKKKRRATLGRAAALAAVCLALTAAAVLIRPTTPPAVPESGFPAQISKTATAPLPDDPITQTGAPENTADRGGAVIHETTAAPDATEAPETTADPGGKGAPDTTAAPEAPGISGTTTAPDFIVPPQQTAPPAIAPVRTGIKFNGAADLMAEARKNAVHPTPGSLTVDPASADKVADFALRLFRTCDDGDESLLISPFSVLSALGMTELGAEGETLSQMEEAIGMDRDQTGAFFRAYLEGQKNSSSLRRANSIWIRDREGFTVKDGFLSENAGIFDADVFKAPFDDGTLEDINAWVKDRTDGKIPRILDGIDPDDVTVLINALSFEGEWFHPYTEKDVKRGIFTSASGVERETDFLCGLDYGYMEGSGFTGFIKEYKGCNYGFAALLPDKGQTTEDLMGSLDGAELRTALEKCIKIDENKTVATKMPKFSSGSSFELEEVLKKMGITEAFDRDKADFSGFSNTGSYLSGVLHKTFITVAEKGTEAVAATRAVIASNSDDQPKEVTLDRPFVYMIFDTEDFIPIFIGALRDVK